MGQTGLEGYVYRSRICLGVCHPRLLPHASQNLESGGVGRAACGTAVGLLRLRFRFGNRLRGGDLHRQRLELRLRLGFGNRLRGSLRSGRSLLVLQKYDVAYGTDPTPRYG